MVKQRRSASLVKEITNPNIFTSQLVVSLIALSYCVNRVSYMPGIACRLCMKTINFYIKEINDDENLEYV